MAGTSAVRAEFVTSTRLPPRPFGGLASDDSVVIGDSVPFRLNSPGLDWFQVSDAETDEFPFDWVRKELLVQVTTPLDIIQGTGFLRDVPRSFMEFVVDRLRVKKQNVCRP